MLATSSQSWFQALSLHKKRLKSWVIALSYQRKEPLELLPSIWMLIPYHHSFLSTNRSKWTEASILISKSGLWLMMMHLKLFRSSHSQMIPKPIWPSTFKLLAHLRLLNRNQTLVLSTLFQQKESNQKLSSRKLRLCSAFSHSRLLNFKLNSLLQRQLNLMNGQWLWRMSARVS